MQKKNTHFGNAFAEKILEWEKEYQTLPKAEYIVENDRDFTICDCNRAFCGMVGCTKEELMSKYGGRLRALLSAESSREFEEKICEIKAGGGDTFRCRQKMALAGKKLWLYTEVQCKGSQLYCKSFDISESEMEMERLTEYKDVVQFVSEEVKTDVFTYNYETKTARIYADSTVVPKYLMNDKGEIPDFVGKMITEGCVLPQYQEEFMENFRSLMRKKGRTSMELRVKDSSQAEKWVKLTMLLRPDNQYDGYNIMGVFEDITQQKEAALNYLNETQFYQAIVSEKTAYAHVDVTEDRITRIGGMWNLYNEVIDKITYSELIEQFINKVVHQDDRKHYLELMQKSNFIESMGNGINRLGCDFRRIVEQNKMMWMQLSVHLFKDPFTHHILALLWIVNIDAEKKHELALIHHSNLDELTNVYNRRTAENEIEEYLKHVGTKEHYAFLIVDLDDFKLINDTYGHQIGDRVLSLFAGALSRMFRKTDVIGRFGGDEFLVLLKDVDSRQSVEERLGLLGKEIEKEDAPCNVSYSIGIALGEGCGEYQKLFRQADVALYHAKNKGKNCYFYYDDSFQPDNIVECKERIQRKEIKIEEMSERVMETVSSNPSEETDFDAFIGSQGDIAYLVDPETFELICGNEALYDRIGLTRIQCDGMKCYEVMQNRETPCPFCSKANWSTDKFYMWKNLNTVLEQEFLIKNKLVTWNGKEALLALAVDVSNDKSIVDSIDNGVMESHCILSGVQHMAAAKTLPEAIFNAMETIGVFFSAEAVSFWERLPESKNHTCTGTWKKKKQDEEYHYDEGEISQWLETRNWEQPVWLENPEAMLCFSYAMYQDMKKYNIRNQRWYQIKDGEKEVGCICIDNCSSNFQNVAFLESFCIFMVTEIRKRSMIESAIRAGQHDDLTGLMNRASFEAYITSYRPDDVTCIGVIIANFNNLKGINSTSGFQTGNFYIKEFADMLRELFGEKMSYRLNGDEFLAVLPEFPRTALEDRICTLEEKIKESGSFTVSFGYAWDDVENDLSVLIEQATQSMKVNKKRHYDSMPEDIGAERKNMLNGLMESIGNREFVVYLQPKVELGHKQVIGAEALIRYNHKEHGILQPAQFIEVLEKNNLIRYVDLFVFEEVCRILEEWKKQGKFLPIISLNFSRLTLLERDILSSMEYILAKYDVSRKNIEIEITESMANMGKSVLYQAASDLYQAGFAIALDDFGTKYTNLSILADLDFSILKLDKSLLDEADKHLNRQHILKNVISMCKDLGMTVLAEGIETKLQEEILDNLECELGQGYLYGKPMPIDEFEGLYIK